ncbi:MAG: endonuclease/exonuclease/phosphatase family protein [Bacilli bacterium]|jgi:endonuclease/exonuclease/phosphatase family metal-dependent hydrolase|nr:endonuclease/exonuclease/phosphatase family protein [Bacilli bacterium]MDD4056894.1 endonuclease/exonuclease/phosphatase family protein [Bacilli bacterium]MDY0209152.1 endonuclease/exonuclease/phosphatase family protein [Bacilli bacterium]
MKKALRIAGLTLLSIFVVMVLFVIGYVVKLSVEFYRIDDETDLTAEIVNHQEAEIAIGNEYTIVTMNIGFGAYTKEFSFFMDSGVMLDGTAVAGKNSTAKSKEVVLTNTKGAIDIVSSFTPDFAFFQEVDIESTRSYKVNQLEMIRENFSEYASSFALNFHSSYLLYPFQDPHGAVNGGIATFSKYKITESMRYKLPIDESFPVKFFDLDRCFMITRIPVSGNKELVLINVHLSAYDKGGVYRQLQLEKLNTILEVEKNIGNYVIVGGDFNHDIADSLHTFATEQFVPEWVYVFDQDKLTTGYNFATSNAHPTCRSTDIPYQKDVNYTVVIDGFIISDNIEEISVENVVMVNGEDVSFVYSDHNAVVLKFKLK